jgi:hypothetical protein
MPGCQTREENAADLAREELVGGVFALALNDAAQDVLGYFDGLGIPPVGETQRDDLEAEVKAALDSILREWCV